MYGIYVRYSNGNRERLGVTKIVPTRNSAKKTYCVWDSEEAAQRCADLLMSHSNINHIVKAEVKECKR